MIFKVCYHDPSEGLVTLLKMAHRPRAEELRDIARSFNTALSELKVIIVNDAVYYEYGVDATGKLY